MVLLFVTIGVSASVLLNYSAKHELNFQYLALVYFLVLMLNIARFLWWGKIIRKFNLSAVYPLTSLFFPVIYAVSLVNQESELTVHKISGVAMIFLGVVIFEYKSGK